MWGIHVDNDITVPDSFDAEWQATQLRKIAHHLENLDDMNLDEVACDELKEIFKYVEVLREYSGY